MVDVYTIQGYKKILRKKSNPINLKDIEKYSKVINTLKAIVSREELNAKGLAAIQLGNPIRLFVMRIEKKKGFRKGEVVVVINPTIITGEEVQIFSEGCLSIPGIICKVPRANSIIASYVGEKGEQKTANFTGIDACCFQHEYDHLEGILMMDKEINEGDL